MVLEEEVKELVECLREGTDLNNLVKELTDCLTGVLLAAVYCGVNLDAAFDLTFRSHLSKLIDAKYSVRGKLLKGPNYMEPDFSFLIDPVDLNSDSLNGNIKGGPVSTQSP